mmetsp:Transcript_147507/g.268945  ORF Transcript_147507/g.268945 Transcript_147507/m.268945 type:complete len:460 (-) Transcript_147507:126-1505(-)
MSPAQWLNKESKQNAKQKRMQVMMENSTTYSDVEFRVGEEGRTFRGLKAIFARASEVFAKMFFEAAFRERTSDRPIVIIDVQPVAFEQLHRWVYDMDVVLSCEIVFGVLEAARKYMVEDLVLHCQQWIAGKSRNPDDCVHLLAVATETSNMWLPALAGRAESFGAKVLACPMLTKLPFQALVQLLESPDFATPNEECIFEACKAWANAACERNEDEDAAWQQIVDQEVVHFHLLSPRYFAESVVNASLLTQEKALEVFMKNAMQTGLQRKVSTLGRLRALLIDVTAEDATSCIEKLVEISNQENYSRAVAQCLVERALMDHEHCSEWVSMWNELWGALRVAGLRDECVRATIDHCQNLFEEDAPPDSLVGVWTCPDDTLGLVRILCKLNDSRKLAVLPLIKVLEVLIGHAEDGKHALCEPASAARELVAQLNEVSKKCGHLAALQSLPALVTRLEALRV